MVKYAETLKGVTRLSEQNVARYHEQGYLGIEGFFTPTEVAEMQTAFSEYLEMSRSVTENDDIFELEASHTAENPMIRRLRDPDKLHPAFLHAMNSDKTVDLLAQLIGENIRFRDGKLNSKPPFDGSPVEWHQDWAHFPHTNDDMAVIGVAINDQTEENGCLKVVPGSHKGPTLDHHEDGFFRGAVNPIGLVEDAVSIALPAGGISVHHIRTLHGSPQNRSTSPRLLMLFTYAAGDAWPLVKTNDWNTLNAGMIRGELSVTPRMKDIPVRVPYPSDLAAGSSIFDIQGKLKTSGFSKATM